MVKDNIINRIIKKMSCLKIAFITFLFITLYSAYGYLEGNEFNKEYFIVVISLIIVSILFTFVSCIKYGEKIRTKINILYFTAFSGIVGVIVGLVFIYLEGL